MSKTALACLECGYRALQWLGRCPQCSAWESFAEEPAAEAPSPPGDPVPLSQVVPGAATRTPTGIGELDRVLGGGMVGGATVLLAGEPGVGKSTLMLQAAAGVEAAGRQVLLVCGEESIEQVAARAARVAGPRHARAFTATEVTQVAAQMQGFDVVVVDSIQSLRDAGLSGEAGSVNQVRSCAATLAGQARSTLASLLLIGHVTKDGAVAGPRVLEHLVDAVLTFEGDRGHALRTVRATKNRFGATSEIGIFEMGPGGLAEVPDASSLFLADRARGVPGSCAGCLMEGRRALAVEIQTLSAAGSAALPRRVADGIAPSRLALMIAVLEQRAGISFAGRDVYASVAGGFHGNEPACDLALAIALASSALGRAVPDDLVAIGEVGLAGEVRAVPGLAARLGEAARLGFTRALVPYCEISDDKIELLKIRDLNMALGILR